MSNLTYNPNVDIPAYNGFNDNDGPRAMDFPSDGNFRGSRVPDISYDIPQRDQYREQRYDVQYEPRIESRIDQRREAQYEQYDGQVSRSRKKTKERMTAPIESSTKFNWVLLLKKLVIYTILFLVFNHIKTHQILCGLIPFFSNNEVLCMTFKGLLFAVIITVLLPMVL